MRYSKQALQEMAPAIFEKLGKKKLFATTDGQFFAEQNRADLHANGKMAVYELDSDPEETGGQKLSAEEIATMAADKIFESLKNAAHEGNQTTELEPVIEANTTNQEGKNEVPGTSVENTPAAVITTAASATTENTVVENQVPGTPAETTIPAENTPVLTNETPVVEVSKTETPKPTINPAKRKVKALQNPTVAAAKSPEVRGGKKAATKK